ncbi:MAG TPA: BAX inhibitor protein [Gammaproteobacteria bacterium]|nr:BAX inhibitor protein [Gammaproteobacteria bacterium]
MDSQVQVAKRQESILATNKVLRNTYFLLSLTLLFSAGTAGTAMALNVPPVHWLIQLGGMFGLLFLVHALRNSVWGIAGVFAFTGFLGFTLGPMLDFYFRVPGGSTIVMSALGTTGAVFIGLSTYTLTTKKDFSFMGGFLMTGLIVGLVAMVGLLVANYFFNVQVAGLYVGLSALFALLMSGFILFDTSRIIHGGETNYLMATISLYLNIYLLFVHLLNLFTALSGDD